MIRLKDIAEKAGVSPTTVSNVIHGNTKRVSEQTIQKVQRILQESKYVPSMAARLLSQNSSNIISVIISYKKEKTRKVTQDPFVSEILGALEENIQKHGYFMMLYTTQETIDIFRLATTWNAAGMIILGFTEKDCINLRKQTAIPFVTVDSYFDELKTDFINVGLSDYDGGYLMGKYLVENGHTKILFLADNLVGVDYWRWCGFQQALWDHHVTCDQHNMILLENNDYERKLQYNQLLSTFKKQTALFFASDFYAVEGINYLSTHGIKVPKDLSIAGFDNNIFSEIIQPKLTTVNQNVGLKASVAIDCLVDLIEGREEKIAERERELPVQLILRDSVKKIN